MAVVLWFVVTGVLLGNGHAWLALLGMAVLLCGSRTTRTEPGGRPVRRADDPRPDLHLAG